MKVYKAVRSYSRRFTGTNERLNEHLEKGYKVIMVTPFITAGNTEYLEYILEKDNTPPLNK